MLGWAAPARIDWLADGQGTEQDVTREWTTTTTLVCGTGSMGRSQGSDSGHVPAGRVDEWVWIWDGAPGLALGLEKHQSTDALPEIDFNSQGNYGITAVSKRRLADLPEPHLTATGMGGAAVRWIRFSAISTHPNAVLRCLSTSTAVPPTCSRPLSLAPRSTTTITGRSVPGDWGVTRPKSIGLPTAAGPHRDGGVCLPVSSTHGTL